jgi:CBS domain-containing protein
MHNKLRERNMSVAQILAVKGRDVVTTQPHRTLNEIAEILLARNIGAVVIADVQGNVLGILSERDIVRAIGRSGADALQDAASAHMTSDLVTTSDEETVDSTMGKMNLRRCRHLPVLKNGKLDGILSIGDVIKFRLAEMEHEHSAMRDYIATA